MVAASLRSTSRRAVCASAPGPSSSTASLIWPSSTPRRRSSAVSPGMALAAGGLGHAVQLRARCLPGRCSRYSRGAARRYGSIRGRRGDIRVQARADAELLLDLLLDLVGGVGVVAQEVAGIL